MGTEMPAQRELDAQDPSFFYLYNRYSPVLIQAVFQQRHLHRDGRGRIHVHLSSRICRKRLPFEEAALPGVRVINFLKILPRVHNFYRFKWSKNEII